jgi:hypothetical protein
MPISINGSGTVTGVSVGGLPDGIVDTDMLAANAVTSSKRGAGAILQAVTKKTTTEASYTNASAQDYIVLTSDAITVSAGSTLLVFGNYHFWMQEGADSSFHGRQYLQREIGGNNSWSDIRGVGTATFELAHTGNTINNLCYLVPVNAIYTHGQSAGTSIKVRIVHRSVQPGTTDLLVFQRNGNETNLTIMEVAG